MLRLLLAALAGAALAYFLDPTSGRRRRSWARDRLRTAVRRGGRLLSRPARAATSVAYSLGQKAVQPSDTEREAPNDAALAQRVESVVFPQLDVPKGRVNINAERSVVVLRGELDRPEQIQALEEAVRQVPGVKDVRNLLHLPGTPAPGTAADLS